MTARRFDDLTADQKSRVDTLLGEIEHYAKDSSLTQAKGMIGAMAAALDGDRSDYDPDSPHSVLFGELPRDRFAMLVDNMRKSAAATPDPDDDVLVARFEKEAEADQRKLYALAVTNKNDHLNGTRLDRAFSALAGRYDEVGKLAPFLVNQTDDLDAMEKLADACSAKSLKGNLGQLADHVAGWERADKTQRLQIIKSTLTRAFGEDEMKGLHVMSTSAKGIGGAYIAECDTMAVSEMILNMNDPAVALTVLAHEYQHRRQRLLVNKMENPPATATAEQKGRARLFKANFSGGYISPIGKGIWGALASFGPYVRQPVEQNANDASMAFAQVAAERGGVAIWLNNKLMGAGSRVVRPIDRLLRSTRRGFGLLDKKDSRPPAPPAG